MVNLCTVHKHEPVWVYSLLLADISFFPFTKVLPLFLYLVPVAFTCRESGIKGDLPPSFSLVLNGKNGTETGTSLLLCPSSPSRAATVEGLRLCSRFGSSGYS